ncbi:MAG: hypothetical protein RH859_04465 [Longimicrobiales bacterium]
MILIVRILAGALAAFWLAGGALVLGHVVSVGSVEAAVPLGVLMAGNGVALALVASLVLRGRPLVDHAGVLLFAANAALSLTDQIGILDLLSFTLSAALVVLVLIEGRSLRRAQSP